MEVATCYNCTTIKPIGEFNRSTLNRGIKAPRRGRCRDCHAEYDKVYYLKKRIEKYPGWYSYCDDCDESFLDKYKNKVSCKFCESKNIRSYG